MISALCYVFLFLLSVNYYLSCCVSNLFHETLSLRLWMTTLSLHHSPFAQPFLSSSPSFIIPAEAWRSSGGTRILMEIGWSTSFLLPLIRQPHSHQHTPTCAHFTALLPYCLCSEKANNTHWMWCITAPFKCAKSRSHTRTRTHAHYSSR